MVSTAAYAALYLAFRNLSPAVVANALALVVTAVGNTAANRRFTFGVRGGGSMVRDQVGGLVALAVALAITTVVSRTCSPRSSRAPSRPLELVVLVAANGLATVSRFVVLRSWISRDHRREPIPTTSSGSSRHGSLS